MLAGLDRILEWAGWLAAAALVVMLLAGPALIAHDKAGAKPAPAGKSPYGKPSGPDGKQIFAANCGTCHTLSRAGTSGSVGPKLDSVGLAASDIETLVRSGSGVMPSFSGKLSAAEITAVAKFVAGG